MAPAANEEIRFGGPSPVVRHLVGSLHRTGATSAAGLALLAKAWADVCLEDSTHWQDLLAINHEFVSALIDNEILTGEETKTTSPESPTTGASRSVASTSARSRSPAQISNLNSKPSRRSSPQLTSRPARSQTPHRAPAAVLPSRSPAACAACRADTRSVEP